MRAAIYARVSTSDQNNSMQISELEVYAKARNWKVVQLEQDQMSGAKAKRPGLMAILEAARQRKIDVVLVWKLDRFGRSVKDLLFNIQILESAGVRFIATTQGIDTDVSNPVSRFTLTILAAVAELEREMICERVRAGIQTAKEKGTQFGRPRIIFRRDQALKMREAGATIRDIATKFDVSIATVHRLIHGTISSPEPVTKLPDQKPGNRGADGQEPARI